MKHVLRAANYVGLRLDDTQVHQLSRYRDWLAGEAMEGGGIGPEEGSRLEQRHLADSLLFFAGFPTTPGEVWDLGTGVGLPGVPLAIALPDTEFLLIDRSGRRIDLTRRIIRILELQNCQVIQGEIGRLAGRTSAIVSRAGLPPDELAPLALRYLSSGGIAVIGGSWSQPPVTATWETLEIPAVVLDRTVWILIMRVE